MTAHHPGNQRHPAFRRTDHRPWPLPAGRWMGRQSWRDLLFAHWPVPAAVAQALVPAPLRVQEFEGTSWIGLVPFRMAGVTFRPLPALPGLSAFPELNVRLYVEYQGKPGVWFLSLDATSPLAVWGARRFFHLPYFRADIDVAARGEGIGYRARRRGEDGWALQATYAPTAPPFQATSGTLEHWLTERYCLYARAPDGSLWRDEIHHLPWPLQKAEATFNENTYLSAHGVAVSGEPLLHFARRLDVVVWKPERLAGRSLT
jgi:uncharacterized protein YqjF (DUF2071 family)